MKLIKTSIFALSLLISYASLATPDAIKSEHELFLTDFDGMTFLQSMIAKKHGIVANFDRDYTQSYDFASDKEVLYAVDNFDHKNRRRVMKPFKNSKKRLLKFAQKLRKEQKTFTPSNISSKVGRVLSSMKIRGDKYALGQFFAIASGAGTLIHIDEDNYYYNIGYYAPEVRSGRSYGATTLHNANDASHLMYLRELEKFLKHENDYRLFYTAIMNFLTDTDVSVYDNPNFNHLAEAVLTDYITVYTAELRRHLMNNLHPRRAPWGNDMTEATFLSLFNVKSGYMMLDEGLVKASIKEHWALSKTGSGRSGFGINRSPRRKLQSKISNYFRYHKDKNKREHVLAIDKLIGKRRDGDIYRATMEFLNNRKNLKDPSRVENIEEELVEHFVEFLMDGLKESSHIVKTLH